MVFNFKLLYSVYNVFYLYTVSIKNELVGPTLLSDVTQARI